MISTADVAAALIRCKLSLCHFGWLAVAESYADKIVGAFSSLREDVGMMSLHAMQLLDAVECDVEDKPDQAVDLMDPDESGMIMLVDS